MEATLNLFLEVAFHDTLVDWVGADRAGQARKLLQEQEDATSVAVRWRRPFEGLALLPLYTGPRSACTSMHRGSNTIGWMGGRR